MRYRVEMDGHEANAQTLNRYEVEVHADHAQEARTIALVQAESVGLHVSPESIEVSSARK